MRLVGLYSAGRFHVVAKGDRFGVVEDILNGNFIDRGSKFASVKSASAHADRWNAKWKRSTGPNSPTAPGDRP